MRYFLGLALLLGHTLSFALSPTDDIVCYDGNFEGNQVYLRTQEEAGHTNLVVMVCDGTCVAPPYLFENSYMVTYFGTGPQNHGGPNDQRWLHVFAHNVQTRVLASANVTIDLEHPNLAAKLVLSSSEQTAEIEMTRCEIVPGGLRPRPNS